jgi:tetratricopeptide (TPR) repeat protein
MSVEYRDIKASLEEAQSSLANAKTSYDKLRTYIAIGNSYILLSEYEDARVNLMNALLAFDKAEKIVKTVEGRSSAEIETQKGYLFFKLSFTEEKEFNLKRSIEHYEEALLRLANEKDADKIFHVKYNLANSLIALSDSNHKENIERAINILKDVEIGALKLSNGEALALAKNAEGVACLLLAKLISGDKILSELNSAISAFNEAEVFYTKAAYPLNYASCENEIGAALLELAQKKANAQQVLEDAILHFKNAIAVYTEDESPTDYASTCYNLGISYARLAKVGNSFNQIELLGSSIKYFEMALSVFAFEDYPKEFAKTSFELGTARREKFLLDRDISYLEKEIENFKGVLRVFDRKENPFTYLSSEFFIGESLYFLGKVDEAKPFYEEALKIAREVDEKLAEEIHEVFDSIWKQ